MTKEYVLGFAFDPRFKNVLLIKKNRPEWQAGLLNGIGGKMEANENFEMSMVREFKEETGIQTNEESWKQFGEIVGDGFAVYLLWNSGHFIYDHESPTDERVDVYEVSEVLLSKVSTVANLPAIIAALLNPEFRNLKTELIFAQR